MLEMINKVQMFQIACNKVNKSLSKRKLNPVFDLKVVRHEQRDVEEEEPPMEVQSPGASPSRTAE